MKKLLLITALLIASNGLAQKYLSQYDIDEERFGNERMAAIAKVNNAITREMIATLLRGEPVDWQPREDSATRHKG